MSLLKTSMLELIASGLELPNEKTISRMRLELQRKKIPVPADPRTMADALGKTRKNGKFDGF